jgi:putative hemolysin
LTAIVGNFVSHLDEGDEPMVVERHDRSLLIAGTLPADALANQLGIELPDDRDYATAAGYALSVLKHLPGEGEWFVEQNWRFEIVDMDGRKIDKLLASKVRKPKRAVSESD